MKNKRIAISIGSLATASLPIIAAISCGSSEKESLGLSTYENAWDNGQSGPHLSKASYYDATVKHWVDGDTLNITKKTGNKDEEIVIRVRNIDTPEINHNHAGSATVDAAEEAWGNKATDLAKSLIPVGSKIRIVTNGTETYGRIVGSVFFGKKFERNLEVELLMAGLALPTMKNADTVGHSWDANYYIGLDLARAYNYAVSHKIGLFSLPDLKALKVHGTTIPDGFDINEPDNIYQVWERSHNNGN